MQLRLDLSARDVAIMAAYDRLWPKRSKAKMKIRVRTTLAKIVGINTMAKELQKAGVPRKVWDEEKL